MASTYEPIASTTLGSSAATVEFTSLSGSFTDLLIVAEIGTTGGGGNVQLQVNSDTGSNYSHTLIQGNGTSVASARQSAGSSIDSRRIGRIEALAAANENFVNMVTFLSYANTNVYKTYLAQSHSASTVSGVSRIVGLWQSTSAITSLSFDVEGSLNFRAGSTFSLFGVKAA